MRRGGRVSPAWHLGRCSRRARSRGCCCAPAAAQVLACSHEQLADTPEGWIKSVWQAFGTEIVLVGCGADGVLVGVRAGRRIWHVPAVTPRGVHYASGAGDTLLAAFVHHLVTLGDPAEAARWAVLCAGWKVGDTPDEEPGIPWRHLQTLRTIHGLPPAIARQ